MALPPAKTKPVTGSSLSFGPLLETIDDYAFNPIRVGIYKTTGIATPIGRLGVYSTVAAGWLFFTKPSRCFNSDGSMKDWLLFNPLAADRGTYVPFWLEAFTAGYVAHLFI